MVWPKPVSNGSASYLAKVPVESSDFFSLFGFSK